MSRNMDPMKITPEYWAECLADEQELAPLMGWARLNMPSQDIATGWIFGSNHAEFTSVFGPQVTSDGIKPVPRWRRDQTALGSLIEKVPANVRWDPVLLMVHVWIDPEDGPPIADGARFKDHPTDGHALRKALVRLAITYLSARRHHNDALRHTIDQKGNPQ